VIQVRTSVREPWADFASVDDEIIVALPGTSYSVTYFKRAKSPQLFARNISHTDDLCTPNHYRISSAVCGAQLTRRRASWGVDVSVNSDARQRRAFPFQ
jgi:hypothetical protein